MASGIFPLDGINPAIGRRLRTKDFDAAAQRLLRQSDEIAEENNEWKAQLKLERKRKLHEGGIEDSGKFIQFWKL